MPLMAARRRLLSKRLTGWRLNFAGNAKVVLGLIVDTQLGQFLLDWNEADASLKRYPIDATSVLLVADLLTLRADGYDSRRLGNRLRARK
jgi:hypothetical protein